MAIPRYISDNSENIQIGLFQYLNQGENDGRTGNRKTPPPKNLLKG